MTTFLLIVLAACAYGIQTAAGFGAGLVLVTLGMHLVDLPTLLALVMPLSIAQTGWITLRHHHTIERPLLIRRVIPIMGTGMAGGYLIALAGGGRPELKQALGVLVLGFAVRELWRIHKDAPPAQGGRLASILSLFGAGIVHGVYGAGGPLLVYGLGRENLDRARFRSTITAVWFLLNLVLVATFAVEGRYTSDVLRQIPILFLGIPVGVVLGEKAFALVDERTFKVGVYVLVTLAAFPLLWG